MFEETVTPSEYVNILKYEVILLEKLLFKSDNEVFYPKYLGLKLTTVI